MSDGSRSLDQLRDDLKKNERSWAKKYADRINEVENLRPLAALLAAVGAGAAGASRLIPESVPASLWIAIIGATVGILAAGAVGLLDRRKLDIGQEAKVASEIADKALQQAKSLESRLKTLTEAAVAIDKKRRSRLSAVEDMIVSYEAGLLNGASDRQVAEAMLRASIGNIHSAIDFKRDDVVSISIYRRQGKGDDEKLARIATQWSHPQYIGRLKNFCARKDGFSGHAWDRACDVIIPDTSPEHVRREYPVYDSPAEIEKLYRSVAAIPILVSKEDRVWGVLFASSSRVNVFTPDESPDGEEQNVGTIRQVALMVALLDGLQRAPDRTSAETN